MYVAWSRIRERTSTEAYARRAIVSAFLDETRRPWWRRERLPDELPDAAVSDDAFGDIDGQLDGGAIRRALAELPPRMRVVVVLRHELDLSIEETAPAWVARRGRSRA
jgi:DNA-directed RNA polymerase specialized sigma24 family protein